MKSKWKKYRKYIIVVVFLILIKLLIEFHEPIVHAYLEKNYTNLTSELTVINYEKFLNLVKNPSEKPFIIFLGRKTCSDCLHESKKIKNYITEYKRKNYHVYYFNCSKENISNKDEYDQVMKNLKIENIPTLIIFNKSNPQLDIKQYDTEDWI